MAAKPSTAKDTGTQPASAPVTATPSSIRRNTGPEVLTGAQAIVRSLEKLEVDTVFGLPGGTILPTYDPLFETEKIRHILVRHEQGAGHAAEGYAAASGKLGVCIATSGPGATNLITALADANMDSVPMLAITGQQASSLLGTDAFQEADIVGMTMPVTKHSFLVTRAEDIPGVLVNAHHIATTGRPGRARRHHEGRPDRNRPFVCRKSRRRPATVRSSSRTPSRSQAARMMSEAQRPVFYIGGGVVRSEAEKEPRLAEATNIPVVTTLMARGRSPTRTSCTWACPECTAACRRHRLPEGRPAHRHRRPLR